MLVSLSSNWYLWSTTHTGCKKKQWFDKTTIEVTIWAICCSATLLVTQCKPFENLCFVHPIFLSLGFGYFGHFSCMIFLLVFFPSGPSCLAKCKQILRNIFVFSWLHCKKWPKTKNGMNETLIYISKPFFPTYVKIKILKVYIEPISNYRGSPTYTKITNTVSTNTFFGLCMCKWGN